MNPDSNQFEALTEAGEGLRRLLRPNGEPVPAHWTVLTVGEHVVVKGYTFKVAYINETTLVLEPGEDYDHRRAPVVPLNQAGEVTMTENEGAARGQSEEE